jgi:hypothetical protein
MIKQYIVNILIAVDQLANTIFGGAADETVSSRLGRNYPNSVMADIVNTLFFWQNGEHCRKSIEPKDRAKGAVIK